MSGGEQVETEELVNRVIKFEPYFCDEGGVTISGGEPLVQAKELIPFIKALKKQKINIAIDTGGIALSSDVKEVIKLCDTIILDLKFATEDEYQKYVKGSLKTVIKFLDECEAQKKNIWVRIVVVPNINDTKEKIKEYINLLKGRTLQKTELLPFHTLGFSKYQKLGVKNPLEQTPALCPKKCHELQQFLDLELGL